mmetsp:Transcript_6470/g.19612  ORF Transcript_6470/g.19612 Transcript_6470/m.19612 type:complete len:209 (+) Transcript_6470:330-956(+)
MVPPEVPTPHSGWHRSRCPCRLLPGGSAPGCLLERHPAHVQGLRSSRVRRRPRRLPQRRAGSGSLAFWPSAPGRAPGLLRRPRRGGHGGRQGGLLPARGPCLARDAGLHGGLQLRGAPSCQSCAGGVQPPSGQRRQVGWAEGRHGPLPQRHRRLPLLRHHGGDGRPAHLWAAEGPLCGAGHGPLAVPGVQRAGAGDAHHRRLWLLPGR